MINSVDKKSYYNEYWSDHREKLNEHEIIRLYEIKKAISLIIKNNPKNYELEICDLGCGRGWLSKELSIFGHVTGIDLSDKGIELAREKWKDVSKFEVQDILTWRPEKNMIL